MGVLNKDIWAKDVFRSVGSPIRWETENPKSAQLVEQTKEYNLW